MNIYITLQRLKNAVKDIKNWKAEEKEWIEQDLSVADDSIELLCELKKNNLDVVLQKINEEIRNA